MCFLSHIEIKGQIEGSICHTTCLFIFVLSPILTLVVPVEPTVTFGFSNAENTGQKSNFWDICICSWQQEFTFVSVAGGWNLHLYLWLAAGIAATGVFVNRVAGKAVTGIFASAFGS